MSKFCLKHIAGFFVFILVFVLAATPVFASHSITSVTLNGASTATVAPSASITVQVTANVSGGGASAWLSTSWNISGANCVNTTDFRGNIQR